MSYSGLRVCIVPAGMMFVGGIMSAFELVSRRRRYLLIAAVSLVLGVLFIPAGAAESTFTFAATADTYSAMAQPGSPRGDEKNLKVSSDPKNIRRSYIAFDVKGLSGVIKSVQLRLTSNVAFSAPIAISITSAFDESMAPRALPAVGDSVGSFTSGAKKSVIITPLTKAITGNGKVYFVLSGGTPDDLVRFSSRESGSAPSLMVTTEPAPTTTVKPTTTTAKPVDMPTTMTAVPLTTPPSTTPSTMASVTNGFSHPGILMSKTQLDFVKSKITAKQEPWYSAFNSAKGSSYASKTYTAKPVASVQCVTADNAGDARNIGCSQHLDDFRAAYLDSLLWYFTGDETYAKKSVEIMNAWSSTLHEIKFDSTYANGYLQAGWSSQVNTRAAEIMRYTYSGWSGADIARFESMLKTVYYPVIKNGWSSGSNWLTTASESMINIGVFTNDRTIFNRGVNYWRAVVPSNIYMTSDGSYPLAQPKLVDGTDTFSYLYKTESQIASNWKTPKSYVNGLTQETCRDLAHTQMAMGGMADAAETALIQGVDLYSAQQSRIVAAMELQAKYMNQYLDVIGGAKPGTNAPSGWNPSGWVCANNFVHGGGSSGIGWEVNYNHYGVRKGLNLPETKKVVERLRPASYGTHNMWETLTEAGTGTVPVR